MSFSSGTVMTLQPWDEKYVAMLCSLLTGQETEMFARGSKIGTM